MYIIHIHIHICMCIHTPIYICMCIYVRIDFTYVYTQSIHAFIHIHVSTHVCVYICVCLHKRRVYVHTGCPTRLPGQGRLRALVPALTQMQPRSHRGEPLPAPLRAPAVGRRQGGSDGGRILQEAVLPASPRRRLPPRPAAPPGCLNLALPPPSGPGWRRDTQHNTSVTLWCGREVS